MDGGGNKLLSKDTAFIYSFSSPGIKIIRLIAKNSKGSNAVEIQISVEAKPKLQLMPGLYSEFPLLVQMPSNCPANLVVRNNGSPSTVLSYTVADNGALSGFLVLSKISGTLAGNSIENIEIRYKPGLSFSGSMDLILNVYTGSSSKPADFVQVYVRNEYESLLGVW